MSFIKTTLATINDITRGPKSKFIVTIYRQKPFCFSSAARRIVPRGPVYTGLDKPLHGQKLTRFHLAFTWDRRNWTNFSTAKCASSGPEKGRSTFWPARFHICAESCKHPNRATFCSDSAVMAWIFLYWIKYRDWSKLCKLYKCFFN